jgi:bifunctional UDP-N-acetylglucosamine pyrophosphorylase/glucosamine-1-phosphate N-acetyltransferase
MPGVILKGQTTVAGGAELGPDVVLTDTVVGRGAVVRSSTAELATIGDGAVVGPYVELLPGDEVPSSARVRAPRTALR